MDTPPDTAAIECSACADWNQDRAPFRLHGSSYFVGVEGLSVVAIGTGAGLVLIDAGLPQSVPVIERHLATLGFTLGDVRYVLNSHAHFDHAGGIAAIARRTGATVVASALGAKALQSGRALPEDPQHGYGDDMNFPPVTGPIKVLADGETLRLGTLTLRMIATPGHTPGGSSWTWESCEAGDCRQLVFADSLNPVSAPGFRYGPGDGARMGEFRASVAAVAALDCDLMVSAHPSQSQLFEREAAGQLLEPGACAAYARDAGLRLDARAREEESRLP
ncbi:MAG: subclass B3 metallo-beta-lactamase [Arenimonas sp.]|nr:subclass B3 metallo-beta-lactamase [Arenimonas sp.]